MVSLSVLAQVECEGESPIGILWLHEYAGLGVQTIGGQQYINARR